MSVSESEDNPFVLHRAQAGLAVAAGDPVAIKRLYVDLGEGLHSAYADDLNAVPLLSLPETGPVVLGLLSGSHGRILDAGCGPNPAISVGLGRRPGTTVVAMDIGWGTARLARAVAARRGVFVLAVTGDVERLPFKAGAFDAVVCDDTIEHLPDDVAGIAELARVARSGAQIVVATPNRHSLLVLRQRLHDRLVGRRRPASSYFLSNSHLREYSWVEVDRLVSGSLRVLRRAPVGWSSTAKRRLATRLLAYRPLYRVSAMIVVLAERP